MTFPSLRKLLFVAPVFVAVGIVTACGPYGPATGTVPSSPIAPTATTYYYEPVTNAQGQTTYVARCRTTPTTPTADVAGTSLSVINGKLHLQAVDGSKMTCEKFTILVSGVQPAEISIADKMIKITSGTDIKDSDFFQATAQTVIRTGAEGATLVLKGTARLVYVRKGKKLEATAEGIIVNLATGQVLSEMGEVRAAEDCTRTGTAPSAPATSCPPPAATTPGYPSSPTPSGSTTQPVTSPSSWRGSGSELRVNTPLPSTTSPTPR